MNLAEKIKSYRYENDLSQRQFALKCGLSNGYISMLENEINPKTSKPVTPSLQQLNKLAKGMSISLTDLFEQVDDIFISLSDKAAVSDAVILADAYHDSKCIELLRTYYNLCPDDKDKLIEYSKALESLHKFNSGL